MTQTIGSMTFNVTPAQAEQMLGRPVGPNYLGEFYTAVDYTDITRSFAVETFGVEKPSRVDSSSSQCKLHFAILDKNARAETTDEYKRDFVVLVDKIVRDHPRIVPEWSNKAWKMSGLQLIQAERASRL